MRGNFIYKRLGKKVAWARKRLGLSQEEFADRCGVDRTFIGLIEVGKANPSFKTLFKISRACRIKISSLLRGV